MGNDEWKCCGREFKNKHAMQVHKARMHPKKRQYNKTQAKKNGKMVIPININFCPSCGNHIPNAFVMKGGSR